MRFRLSDFLATGVGEQKGGLMPPEETQAQSLDRAARHLQERGRISSETPDKSPAEPGVMLSVPIRSKLGLEQSDHHQSNTKPSAGEPLPSRRARIRRQRW
jgi:hypothetical protein